MTNEFEFTRSERRSFFCANKLWQEILRQTGECTSVSWYIRQAVVEKMIREHPEREQYFLKLLTARQIYSQR